MSPELVAYLALLGSLVRVRWLHAGLESSEEDTLLERMDSAWFALTEAERSYVQALPARSVLRVAPQRHLMDTPRTLGPRRVVVDVTRAGAEAA